MLASEEAEAVVAVAVAVSVVVIVDGIAGIAGIADIVVVEVVVAAAAPVHMGCNLDVLEEVVGPLQIHPCVLKVVEEGPGLVSVEEVLVRLCF